MVRCKFKVNQKTDFGKTSDDVSQIKISASGVQGEPFGKYTPSASLDMTILNDEASAQLEAGKEYIVDIYPAE